MMYVPATKEEIESAERACSTRIEYDSNGKPRVVVDFDRDATSRSLMAMTGGCTVIPTSVRVRVEEMQNQLYSAARRERMETQELNAQSTVTAHALANGQNIEQYVNTINRHYGAPRKSDFCPFG